MKILFATAEFAPFAKAGGLGDMVSALAKSMANRGHEVRVLMPFYGDLNHREWLSAMASPFRVGLPEEAWTRLWKYQPSPKLTIYFLEYEQYFHRPRLYDDDSGIAYHDNPQRFALLSRAAIDLPHYLHWIPDVYHVHDWMTALVPVYLETLLRRGLLEKTASVLTIHNLAHQGYTSSALLRFSGLPDHLSALDQLGFAAGLNVLQGGLYFASKLTTVSQTYAGEIRTPAFGCGLESVLNFRGADLIGILNGIDDSLWNPATDKFLPANYDAANLAGKLRCKRFLERDCGFLGEKDGPLFGVISRLYGQKGLDVLAEILPHILEKMHCRFVILGSGEKTLEERFRQIADRFPDRCFVKIDYDETLAHRIEAASDFFVMPSRFEPCGLNQMYSMRYGTLPLVRATGGLRDSVIPYDRDGAAGTGFAFQDLSPENLYAMIDQVCRIYFHRPEQLIAMRQRAMIGNFSWEKSAKTYEKVYQWAIQSKASSFTIN